MGDSKEKHKFHTINPRLLSIVCKRSLVCLQLTATDYMPNPLNCVLPSEQTSTANFHEGKPRQTERKRKQQ